MAKDEKYAIGIDAGTESCRVGLYDSQGFLLFSSVVEYPTFPIKPGWVEQDAKKIWDAVCRATNEVVKGARVNPEDVIGIGVDGTCSTVVAADEGGRPLDRAILWSDVRAAAQAKKASRTRHETLKYIGGEISAEGMTAKALWIKENRGKLWKKTKHLVETTGWLTYKMTGRWTASMGNASIRWNYVTKLGGWPNDFFEEIGLGDVFEKWPEEVLHIDEQKGTLTEEASNQLGLITGIPVAQGTYDALCGMLGVGAAKPGRIASVMGNSTVLLVSSKKPAFGPGIFATLPDNIGKDLWLHLSGEVSTGSIIRWFRDQFASKEEEEAKKKNKRGYEVLDEKASTIPIGSEGVTILPHWQGSRIYADPLSRGVIQGLTLNTSRAHIFRAILEACAYSTNHGIKALGDGGIGIKDIRACGGGAKSGLLLQIHADVSGLPVYLTEVSEAVSLGSAMLGAIAGGMYKNIYEATDKMVRIKEKVEPIRKNNEKYKFYYKMYEKLYSMMKDFSHETAGHLSA